MKLTDMLFPSLFAIYATVATFVPRIRMSFRGTKIKPAAIAFVGFAIVFWIPALNYLFTLGVVNFALFLIGLLLLLVG
jgi:hypothetical protein